MKKYKQIAYLLGCYMVIADREINALEVDVLDKYLSQEELNELNSLKKLIFSDDEDKPELLSLLSELKMINLTLQQKQEIVRFLADVAYGDDYMAAQENALLKEVSDALNIDTTNIIAESNIKSNQRVDSNRLTKAQRAIGDAVNIIYSIFGKNSNEKTIDLLLGSLGYSASIEQITEIALVDLDRVTKIVDNINKSLVAAITSLNRLNISKINVSKEVAEIEKTITSVQEHFDSLIQVSLRENLEILDKKRRNIRYFTIAFMGRTKAGKSTLHKVITQQKNDDIGVGKIRTTRFNRSWYWNKLRIVDTPGIGAPGGAADTEIAKSIIDEADLICYVVTSDSIQETEFDFFETIKERNKPLYIVLNVKSNLTQPIRLKRFLENPSAWMDSTGPQSIQGHLDRIHERLDGKYNMDAVEIIPIHLLAAQLGFSEETSKEDAKKLCEGSNIFTFTRSVKASVHKSGGLKKSLSVVDGTAYQIHQIRSSLNNDLSQLKDGRDLLIAKLQKFKTFMTSERNKLNSDINSTFSGAKSELHNRAAAFASENYDRSDAGSLWERDSTVKSVYSRMNARLVQRMEDYNEKVKSQIEEIADDIQFVGSFSASSSVSGESITNTRLRVGVFGAILSAATPFIVANLWHPGGWIVAGVSVVVGLVVSLFTSLFTSKAEKIRKATEKMREQLYSSIDKSIEDNQQSFLNNVKRSLDETTKSITKLLSTYIDGTGQIINEIDSLCGQAKQGELAINSLVSFRILEYVGKIVAKDKDIRTLDNSSLALKYPVKRDWTKQTITYLYKVNLSRKDIEKVDQATQMKILTK